MRLLVSAIMALCIGFGSGVQAGQVTVAVASNFQTTAQALKADFEKSSGHQLIIVAGATGKLAAQIMQGAPFDVFLSADAATPAKLLAAGKAVAGSSFTYANGRVALLGTSDEAALRQGAFAHLAIANPKLAPYGAAAMQIIGKLGLADAVAGKIVTGENIGQAFAMASSGNAELGFVALSQVQGGKVPFWAVPADLHEPILQDAVLIQYTAPARAFLEYLRSEPARAIITQAGYDAP